MFLPCKSHYSQEKQDACRNTGFQVLYGSCAMCHPYFIKLLLKSNNVLAQGNKGQGRNWNTATYDKKGMFEVNISIQIQEKMSNQQKKEN